MGNKRKVSNSTALVESEVVHYQSHEPKVAPDKNKFVSIETQMFYDKLALIASPCLERGIDFFGPGNDKINTLTTPSEVRRAFLSEISVCTWSRFVREDATVGNDTIIREFIVNTHKLTGTVVQVRKHSVNFSREVINAYYQIPNIDESEHAIFKHSDINSDMLLWELCDPHVPDGMAKWEFYPTREHKQFLKTWLSPYALVWYHFLTSRILAITHLTKVTRDRTVLLYALVKGVTLRIGSKISPDKPITGPWIRLTLKKHDKSLQDLIAKQQPRAQEEQVVLNSQNHAVYHSRSLHTLHRKLDILAHLFHPTQPLYLPNWSFEPDAPSWHFVPPADDEYGPGSEELEDEYTDHAADDEVGPSGRS
ncbi:hypothetical protein ACH5RR_006776 [Cinchona calisaya]|uniref:Putative plant transposon protein domain-containing protein n=1 Tax=Cinchona calisaya TaxID=153742 RepID=A0ABD3APZ7_9GENT